MGGSLSTRVDSMADYVSKCRDSSSLSRLPSLSRLLHLKYKCIEKYLGSGDKFILTYLSIESF